MKILQKRKSTTIALIVLLIATSVVGEFQIPVLLLISAFLVARGWGKRYTKGLFVGIAILFSVTVAAIYFNGRVVEMSWGDTDLPNKKPATIIGRALINPTYFTASYFGYDCNLNVTPNCPNATYLLGAALSSAILLTSVAAIRPHKNPA